MSLVVGQASGPGAMKAAQFVVVGAVPASLPQGRQLTGSASEIVVTDSGAGNAVTLTAGALIVQTDQANTWTVGSQIIQTAVDTVTAFQVLDADGGAPVLVVDTVNEWVGIGTQPSIYKLEVSVGSSSVTRFSSSNNNSWIVNQCPNNRNAGFLFRDAADAENVFRGRVHYDISANDLQLWTDGTKRVTVGPTGNLLIDGLTATTVGLTIKLAAAQTANAFEVQDSAGAIQTFIASDGRVSIHSLSFIPVYTSLYLSPTITDHASTEYYVMNMFPYWKPTADVAKPFYGGRFESNIDDTNATGNLTSSYYGGYFRSVLRNATRTVSNTIGGDFSVLTIGAAAVTNAYAARFKVSNTTGAINNAVGVLVLSPTRTTGTINISRGVRISDQGHAATTTAYGIYIDSQVTAGTSYAIYTNLGDVRFGDEVVIASPTATALTIGAGTAGIDYTLTFDGETNDGVLTWMEDEARFDFVDDVAIAVDSKGLFLGGAQDMDIGYDGTDGYLRTDLVAASDLNLDCGANKTLELQTTVWKDINIGSAMLSKPAASQPDEEQFTDEAGDVTGIYTLGFAIGEKVSGNFEIQHDYAEGTDFVFHTHWQGIAAPSGTDNVQWRITYAFMRDDTTLDAPTITDSADTPIDTQYESYKSDIVTIDGTTAGNNGSGVLIGDQFIFTLERVAATGDVYLGDALVASVGMHYEINTMGSRQIGTK